jgi:Rap1a immunity proteins
MQVLVTLLLATNPFGVADSRAQDMRNATHNALFDNRMMGFASSAGWLAATCENQDPHSQGTCKGVIWAIADRMTAEGRICIPMNVTSMFQVALGEIAKFRITLPEVMVDPDKASRWSTPVRSVVEQALAEKFPCS